MPQRIAVHIAVANTSVVDAETVARFLAENNSDGRAYRKVVPMNEPRADAFKFMAVLSAVGSAASIASLLWDAYEKFIAHQKTDEDDNSGLMVSVAPTQYDTPMTFWIGGKYKSRDEFEAEFTRITARLDEAQANYHEAVDALMENTNAWLPITKDESGG